MNRTPLWLACAILPAACSTAQQPPSPPEAPAAAQPLLEPDQKVFSKVISKLTLDLLERTATTCPSLLPPVIESAKRDLAEQYAGNEPMLAEAKMVLCLLLLKSAPVFGLAEFEELEMSSNDFDPTQFRGLRAIAMLAYFDTNRPDPAVRLARLVTQDETILDNGRAMAWIILANETQDPRLQDEYLETADALYRRGGEPSPPELVILRMAAGNPAPMRAMVLADPPVNRARVWAAVGTLVIPRLLEEKQLTRAQASGFIEKALSVLNNNRATQRLEDLVCFAAATRDEFPDHALRAATEAEATARAETPIAPERLRIARLCRAKMLNLLGRKDELTAYADLDLREVISASWESSGSKITAAVRTDPPK
jgi:hypothetical protein